MNTGTISVPFTTWNGTCHLADAQYLLNDANKLGSEEGKKTNIKRNLRMFQVLLINYVIESPHSLSRQIEQVLEKLHFIQHRFIIVGT